MVIYRHQANNPVTDQAESERLLGLLDGLPLAIAQAASFLQESGIELQTYIGFYEHQWKELMNSRDWEGAPLQDYPDRSVWTTWAISYKAVRARHVPAANLLLLWAFLDSKDLWYGLFAAAYGASTTTATSLFKWIGDLAINKVEFAKAIQLLRNYSLIEDVEGLGSNATHPVVHRWAYYFQDNHSRVQLAQLAVMVVGWAVPDGLSREDSTLRRQLLPHAQACSRWVLTDEIKVAEEQIVIIDAIHLLGNLYKDLHKLAEAMQMYQRALQDKERTLGVDHTSTLDTVNALGVLYAKQSKLGDAEKMYQRALQGKEKALGVEHTSTLRTVNDLGNLYRNQGKLAEAEQMYKRALGGYEKALDTEYTLLLQTVNNLGILYVDQGKLAEAEQMYQQALYGYEKALGTEHTSTLDTVNNLGILYRNQGKFAEAEQMYQRALDGYEKALGTEHTSTLQTVGNLGILYVDQGKPGEAEQMYQRALHGFEKALGTEHTLALQTVNNVGILYVDQGKLVEAERMYLHALQIYENTCNMESASATFIYNLYKILFGLYKIYRRRCISVRQEQRVHHGTNLANLNRDKQGRDTLVTVANFCEKFGAVCPSLFSILGRMLIWAGQDDDAVSAFLNQYRLEGSKPDQSSTICDDCKKRLKAGIKRFVCKACVDVDLCDECHENYDIDGILRESAENCQAHIFLAIPRGEEETLARSK